jgi:rhodanese-related sulfurtransferase
MLARVMQKAVGHPSVILIAATEAAQLIKDSGAAVMDANPPHRWRTIHVPGAHNVDPAGYGRDELPADQATPLIFYCSSAGCGAAHYAARRAVRMGFSSVHVMTDGLAGWTAQDRPVEGASGAAGQ